MKEKTIPIILAIVILVLMVVLINDYRNGCDSCKMYALMWNKTNVEYGIGGYYSNQGFYCVWTKGLTTKQIASLEEHEKCHALIDKDYEHYCN